MAVGTADGKLHRLDVIILRDNTTEHVTGTMQTNPLSVSATAFWYGLTKFVCHLIGPPLFLLKAYLDVSSREIFAGI